MRRLYALCFVTLAAVLIDIVFFHSGTVSAQNTQQVQIISTGKSSRGSIDDAVVDVTGTAVGFACMSNSDGYGSCYLAVRR